LVIGLFAFRTHISALANILSKHRKRHRLKLDARGSILIMHEFPKKKRNFGYIGDYFTNSGQLLKNKTKIKTYCAKIKVNNIIIKESDREGLNLKTNSFSS
jgi:hypothetical protein